jgi:hypothetical protein
MQRNNYYHIFFVTTSNDLFVLIFKPENFQSFFLLLSVQCPQNLWSNTLSVMIRLSVAMYPQS